ncbi:MAG: hypothetical protein LBI88_00135, partial [Deltaproteobacteria bacterium]|nr:hypothetical protein [Deltaproteobacteria bacterium]
MRYVYAFFILMLHAALCLQSAQAARQIPVNQIQDALPCRPFLEWMLDPGGKLSIQEISSAERQHAFASLDTRFPPHQAGTLWLRFTLGPRALESRPATLLLDIGDGAPGAPLLFVPKNNPFASTAEWQDIQPNRHTVFLLPDAQATPQTLYLRLEGLPDPWFAPMLRTPHNAATAPERMIRPAVLAALGVVMLLCLVRGLTERGQWRIWTSLYVGAVLVYAVSGMPAVPEGIVPIRAMPGMLAPGIALMLLPHVGRHLMQTRGKARGLDNQYLLLSLPGAVLALLPLVPGLAWISYYLALWPLATALLVPTSLGAWLSGLPGARRFLLACLVSMVGATAGILSMYALAPSPLLPAGPLLGVALGALLIAGTAIPKDYEPDAGRAAAGMQEAFAPEESGLRLLPQEELPETAPPPAEVPHPPTDDPRPTTPAQALSVRDAENISALAGHLRPHLDSLLRESSRIALCALPPAARQHAEAIAGSSRAMIALLNNATLGMALERSPAHTVFDLQQLLRETHEQLAGEAERRGLNISWFMPPHLPQYYSGNARGISQIIRLLLESSIRATQQGFVQLAVRRVPESVNPGHLLFSISDSGSGMPPHARNSLALARAWELAGAQGGSMSAESGVQGTTINVTLQLTPQPVSQIEAAVTAQAGRVIIVDELSSNRQLLAFFLEGLPCIVEEARSIEEAALACETECAAVLLIDCDMPETGNLEALKTFLALEREREQPTTSVLAIESESGVWEGLEGLDNVYKLVKPVTRGGLREKILELLVAQHPVPRMPARDPARHEDGASDAELPLDLPPPVKYGPGFAPGGEQFIPLSLDPNLPPLSVMSAAATQLPAPESNRTSPSSAPRVAHARSAMFAAGSVPMRTSVHPPATFPEFPPETDWVGEPVPVPRQQEPASLLRPFDSRTAQLVEAEERMEDMAQQPSLFPDPRQGGLLDWVDGVRTAQAVPQSALRSAPARVVPQSVYGAQSHYGHQNMHEWVGEPVPMPPRQEYALPQRLRDGQEPIPALRPAAPARGVSQAVVYGAQPHYGHRDMDEWVGEPMPMPPRAAPAPPYASVESAQRIRPVATAPHLSQQ